MAEYILNKRYANHYGIDLKSNDLVRDPRFASETSNAQYRKNGTIEKRKGYHSNFGDTTGHEGERGGYGLFTYNKINPLTGDPEVEEITVDENIFRSRKTIITVEYLGTYAGTFFSNVYSPDDGEFMLFLDENTNRVLSFGLGIGLDETTPITIQQMIDAINTAKNIIGSDYAEAGSTDTIINATAHSVLAGDEIIFKTGSLVGERIEVQSVNANDITMVSPFSAAPSVGDKFDFIRSTKKFVAVPGKYSVSDQAETGSTNTVINATGHVANLGDWIVIKSGTYVGEQSEVTSITANTITLTTPLSGAPANGDDFDIYEKQDGYDTSIPAAFLTTRNNDNIHDGISEPYAKKWTQIYSPISNPLSSYYAQIQKDNFINATFVQSNNSVFIGTGYSEILKYDGNSVYRAGLPDPGAVTSAEIAGTGTIINSGTDENYVHKIRYIQYDAAGAIIEGNISETDPLPLTGNANIEVTINHVKYDTGFNTNCAIVNGAQTSTNVSVNIEQLIVDDGSGGNHTMQIGDTAYFYTTLGYVERVVVDRTPTTINIYGAPVTVADNAVISNNLRIGIYRSKDAGGSIPAIFYLVEEIPNNSFVSTPQVYTDVTTDNDLGEFLIEPLTDRSPPPKGKFLSLWNGAMIVSGNIQDPNKLYYSDIDGPEYFPNDTNILNVENVTGDIVTGIVQNSNGFYVFKEISVGWLSGDINSGAFRLEWRSLDTGCESHHTITEVEGRIYWWSSNGPYWSAGGSPPLPVGRNEDGAGRLEPVMDQFGLSSDVILNAKQAVAVNDRREQKWIVFLPADSSLNNVDYANDNSRTFVYDYTRDAWLEWSNYNMMGGATTSGDEFYLMERRLSVNDGAITHYTYRRLNLNESIDYQDHNVPISFKYASQWEALGEPSVLKRFLEVKIFLVEDYFNSDLSLNITQEINYIKDDPRINFDVSAISGGYGQNQYGNSPYGDYADTTVRHSLNRDRVRSMRLVFNNAEDQTNVFLTGWELEIATPYRKGFKQ